MSYNLIINSSNVVGNGNNTFKYKFIKGCIEIPENSLMNISQLTIPYSWNNISASQGNNQITINVPTGSGLSIPYTITIPDGFYQVSDINATLQAWCKTYGLYWYNPILNGNPFVGSLPTGAVNASVTLTVSASLSPTTALNIGQYISFSNGASGTGYAIITATLATQYTYTVKLLSAVGAALNSVAMMSSYSNQLSIIYPFTFSTNITKYGNQIITYTLPTPFAESRFFGC